MDISLKGVRLALIAGIAIMLLMAIFIVLFLVLYKRRQDRQKEVVRELEEQHQKALLEASIRSQEVEAKRIAADLHDDIGTLLSATRMSFSLVTRHLDNSVESKETADHTKKLLEEAVENVRRITKDIQPPALEKLGLVAVIHDLVRKLQQANPDITIDLECQGEEGRLERSIEFTLFRIAQELLHNSLKHSQASRIELFLLFKPHRVILTFSDDGVGFNLKEAQQQTVSLGLKNIESRLNVVGGHVIFETSPGEGTHTIVEIPLLPA